MSSITPPSISHSVPRRRRRRRTRHQPSAGIPAAAPLRLTLLPLGSGAAYPHVQLAATASFPFSLRLGSHEQRRTSTHGYCERPAAFALQVANGLFTGSGSYQVPQLRVPSCVFSADSSAAGASDAALRMQGFLITTAALAGCSAAALQPSARTFSNRRAYNGSPPFSFLSLAGYDLNLGGSLHLNGRLSGGLSNRLSGGEQQLLHLRGFLGRRSRPSRRCSPRQQ